MRDVAKLNAAGKVEFDEASADELFLYAELWEYERREVMPLDKARYSKAKTASKLARELGHDFRPSELEWGEGEWPVRTWDQFKLGLLADHVERIWKRCGGTGSAAWGDKRLGKDGEWGGPVIELMLELFVQLDVPKPRPGRSAIRDAIRRFPRGMKTAAD